MKKEEVEKAIEQEQNLYYLTDINDEWDIGLEYLHVEKIIPREISEWDVVLRVHFDNGTGVSIESVHDNMDELFQWNIDRVERESREEISVLRKMWMDHLRETRRKQDNGEEEG